MLAADPCSGHLLNSKTRGPQVRALARFKRPLKRCRAVKRKILKRASARDVSSRCRRPHHAERICQRNKGSRPQITAEADVQANALSRLLLEIVRSHTS